jgi:micrococcal nuclease
MDAVLLFVLAIAALPPRPTETALVARAVDGDTLALTDGRKVRLIGVDTPELHHPKKPVQAFAAAAQAFTAQAVAGQIVRLVFEKARPFDRYGRLLAYVYREPDGYFLNEALIAGGYAHVEARWPFQHLERFRKAEREARAAGRGLWAD